MVKKRYALLGLFIALATFSGLSFLSQYPSCGSYADWQTSPYVLPYPVGESYAVHQGNCSLGGHHGVYRYSYDFLMPIGSPVTAARAGVVAETLEGHADGDAVERKIGAGGIVANPVRAERQQPQRIFSGRVQSSTFYPLLLLLISAGYLPFFS